MNVLEGLIKGRWTEFLIVLEYYAVACNTSLGCNQKKWKNMNQLNIFAKMRHV